jgi:hypothetical protein
MSWPRVLFLLGLLSACSEGKTPGMPDTADPTGRVKPRLVSVEMPPVVHRQHEIGADGELRWLEPEPLEDVETCAIERRDAYAVFQPYEPLEPPICVTAPAGKYVTLAGLPANSDLTITVSKPDYLPIAMSYRVEAEDVAIAAAFRAFMVTTLLEEGEADLFAPAEALEGRSEGAPGMLVFEPVTSLLVPHAPYPPGATLFDYGSDWLPADDLTLTLVPEQEDDGATWDIGGRPVLAGLDAGIYRARFEQQRMYCEPRGSTFGYTGFGLSTDVIGELELRVLPEHVTSGGVVCSCFPPSPDAVLLDAARCEFATPDPTGSGGSGGDAGH